MKRLLVLPMTMLCLAAHAATPRITCTIVVTNAATNGQTITIAGSTRTAATNVTSPSTQFMVTNTVGWTKTNLYAHLSAYPPGTGWALVNVSSNTFRMVGPAGTNYTVTISPGWATNGYTTNIFQDMMALPVPASAVTNLVLRTNLASGVVEWLNSNPTNQIVPTSAALAGAVVKTNGYSTNQVLQSPKLTNALNYGAAFGSPGPSNYSHQFAGGQATHEYTISIGESSSASGRLGLALGSYASAGGTNTIAIGFGADASTGTNSIALGANSQATGSKTMALGNAALASYDDSIAIGNGVATTRTNEIRLGGSQDVVVGGLLSVAGVLSNSNAKIFGGALSNVTAGFSSMTATTGHFKAGSVSNVTGHFTAVSAATATLSAGYDTNRYYDKGYQTNTTHAGGVTTYALGNALAYARKDISTLANGNNIAVPFGSNVFIRLSGSITTNAYICGVVGAAAAGGVDGQYFQVLNDTGTNVIFAVSTSDPTVANRLLTPTAVDHVVSNQCWTSLLYDTAASRWRVIKTGF